MFGKHTDDAGGRALVAAVPRGIAAAALPAEDGRLIVIDAVSGERVEWQAGDAADAAAGWSRYVATVAGHLAANFAGVNLSARIAFASDLPQAAASAFGAGWGGSVWALVQLAEADDFVDAWLGTYRDRYPQREADGFAAPPVDGVRRR